MRFTEWTLLKFRPMFLYRKKYLEDVVYKTKREKFKAVCDEIEAAQAKHQPVLVSTITIETSELLSGMLRSVESSITKSNAKFHEMEAQSLQRKVYMTQLQSQRIWQDVVQILS